MMNEFYYLVGALIYILRIEKNMLAKNFENCLGDGASFAIFPVRFSEESVLRKAPNEPISLEFASALEKTQGIGRQSPISKSGPRLTHLSTLVAPVRVSPSRKKSGFRFRERAAIYRSHYVGTF